MFWALYLPCMLFFSVTKSEINPANRCAKCKKVNKYRNEPDAFAAFPANTIPVA